MCILGHHPLTRTAVARKNSPQFIMSLCRASASSRHSAPSLPRWNWRPLQLANDMSLSASVIEGKVPPVPRPSASLILVNDRNEVLMIQRNMTGSFGGATAFPGGNFDAKQDNSSEMTAIRETFEETGILLASQRSIASKKTHFELDFEEARKAIHSGKLRFVDFLERNGLNPDTASLLPFSTWVTPPMLEKRFRAQFYVAFLPSAFATHVSGPTSGSHQFRLPTPDRPDEPGQTSTEIVSTKFAHPKDTLAAFARRELRLMPPQFYLLSILKDVFGRHEGADSGGSQEGRRVLVEKLSKGSFGRMTFTPMPLEMEGDDGRKILTFEGDEERGGRKGIIHRSLLESQKGSPVPVGIEILRNFDIFSGYDDIVLGSKAKL